MRMEASVGHAMSPDEIFAITRKRETAFFGIVDGIHRRPLVHVAARYLSRRLERYLDQQSESRASDLAHLVWVDRKLHSRIGF